MLIKLNGMNLRAYYDDDDWDTPAVSHCHGPSTDDSQYVFQLHSIVNHLFGCSKLVNSIISYHIYLSEIHRLPRSSLDLIGDSCAFNLSYR